MPKTELFWEDKEVKVLLKMWKQYSASQIGTVLGRTRNSVIGKIHRLVGNRTIRTRSKKVYILPRNPPRQPIKAKIMDEPIPPPPPPPEPKPPAPINGTACTIYELNDGRCKWPLGATYEVATMFCGDHAEENRPYCHHHCTIAYGAGSQYRAAQ